VRVRGLGPGSAFFVVIVAGPVVRIGGGVLGFWG